MAEKEREKVAQLAVYLVEKMDVMLAFVKAVYLVEKMADKLVDVKVYSKVEYLVAWMGLMLVVRKVALRA